MCTCAFICPELMCGIYRAPNFASSYDLKFLILKLSDWLSPEVFIESCNLSSMDVLLVFFSQIHLPSYSMSLKRRLFLGYALTLTWKNVYLLYPYIFLLFVDKLRRPFKRTSWMTTVKQLWQIWKNPFNANQASYQCFAPMLNKSSFQLIFSSYLTTLILLRESHPPQYVFVIFTVFYVSIFN